MYHSIKNRHVLPSNKELNHDYQMNEPKESLHRFTLIELLVVISIIGILSTMLLPSLRKARESAKMAVCASNQRQLVVANTMYNSSNNGKFQNQNHKGAISWEDSIYTYLNLDWNAPNGNVRRSLTAESEAQIFNCPTDPSFDIFKSNYDETDNSTNVYPKSYAASEHYQGKNWYPGLIGGIYPEAGGHGVWAAAVTMPSQTLLFSELWNYDQSGNQGALKNLLGGTFHTHAAKYTYYSGYRNTSSNSEYISCHGLGKANMAMADGHVEMKNGKSLLEKIVSGLPGARGSWFDYDK